MADPKGFAGLHDPLRPIPPSRHPFQFLVMFALAASGAFAAFGDAPPDSLASLVPAWQADVWGFIMFFGGTLAISSSFWPDRITGLLIERLALGAIGGTCGLYSVVLVVVYGFPNGSLNILMFSAITCACIWRMLHIRRELHRLSRWIEWSNGDL